MSSSARRAGLIAGGFLLAPLWCHAQAVSGGSSHESQASFVTFQVPGSVSTTPNAINDTMTVTGYYANASDPYFTFHGFIREWWGSITTFNAPGSVSTQPLAINLVGTILGAYRDSKGLAHGFLRSPRGTFTSFDATHGTNIDTIPTGMNAFGAVTGYYGPSGGQQPHGFLRDPFGTITLFDPPGSIQTFARGINIEGTIVGNYIDASDVGHGFLRFPWGEIVSFDPPGSTNTIPWSINDAGAVTGLYFDSTGHGATFVRSRNGQYFAFDDPLNNGKIDTGQQINLAGAVVGAYQDATQAFHGFVRSTNGLLTAIDVPGGTNTFAFDINDFGVIIGTYQSGTTQSGYLRVPTGGN